VASVDALVVGTDETSYITNMRPKGRIILGRWTRQSSRMKDVINSFPTTFWPPTPTSHERS
jgi:hypothetical protein